jgi:hypothetical protein
VVAYTEMGGEVMPDTGTSKTPAPQPTEPDSRQGFLNAPWWRLLLWAVIFIAALVLIEKLQILG